MEGDEEIKVKSFQQIGEFMYWFSQLEFLIKLRLSQLIRLKGDFHDIILGPYDFRMLCAVAQAVMTKTSPAGEAEIASFFKQCLALNDERVRIAHGTWAHGKDSLTARHVSRSKLKPGWFYKDPKELPHHIDLAKELTVRVFSVPAKPNQNQGTVKRLSVEMLAPTYVGPKSRKPKPSPKRRPDGKAFN